MKQTKKKKKEKKNNQKENYRLHGAPRVHTYSRSMEKKFSQGFKASQSCVHSVDPGAIQSILYHPQ